MKILLSIFFTILILQANDTSKLSSQVNVVEKEKICKDIKFEEIQQRGCCSQYQIDAC
ncbi:MAG: hypothetical protein PHQ93_07940 [Sulfurimonas sp.]|uniref:hypothetical protein n=1 Tax=Sulfurimonas sp. TaxID=2022749 RepID=UPI0026242C1F|nr:hypothetical protein [Sulfurimonas sp.]MDD5401100.1 hypothetical protein [Sulfurimonas sp.]